jgi:hypothetical protein
MGKICIALASNEAQRKGMVLKLNAMFRGMWIFIFGNFLLGVGSAENLSHGLNFPIGLYGVSLSSTNDLHALKEAGFNCVQAGDRTVEKLAPFLKFCEEVELKAVVVPGAFVGEGYDAKNWNEMKDRLNPYSSLFAWNLCDEPDFNRIDPDLIRLWNRAFKKLIPQRPTALVLGNGQAAKDYAGITDILMVDWYPVPHLPLASFGLAVRQARLAVGSGREVWGVVQAFDWSEVSPKAKRLNLGKFPSEAELWAMSFLGIVEGASGLFFYSHTSFSKFEPLTPSNVRWRALSHVSRKLALFAPLFSAKTVWCPIQISTEPDQPQWRNPLGDLALQICCKELGEGRGAFAANRYVLVVNTMPERRKKKVKTALFEGKRVVEWSDGTPQQIQVVDGWIEEEFEPYGTRIYSGAESIEKSP